MVMLVSERLDLFKPIGEKEHILSKRLSPTQAMVLEALGVRLPPPPLPSPPADYVAMLARTWQGPDGDS